MEPPTTARGIDGLGATGRDRLTARRKKAENLAAWQKVFDNFIDGFETARPLAKAMSSPAAWFFFTSLIGSTPALPNNCVRLQRVRSHLKRKSANRRGAQCASACLPVLDHCGDVALLYMHPLLSFGAQRARGSLPCKRSKRGPFPNGLEGVAYQKFQRMS